MAGHTRQPWIGNKMVETLFILLPPFASLAFIACFPGLFRDNEDIPAGWWVILILLVDVAHVYSTLYRTYFDPTAFKRYRPHLILIPLLGLIAGILLYAAGPWLFWRILAYLAVFHFIRQQYGFLRIYSREERSTVWARRIDVFTIYYASIYPLISWHLGETRNFNWFVDNDFVLFHANNLLAAATVLYYITIIVYVLRELTAGLRQRYVNIPRVAILSGTILSWYFGIIYFNGDMAFTLLNVVSHGIPYMALIWIHGRREHAPSLARSSSGFLQLIFSRYGILLFLGIIFLLAWLEEGFWDMTVWKEHVSLFSVFHLAGHRLHGQWLTFIVPLLALPQLTHYIIDGFIWRRTKS